MDTWRVHWVHGVVVAMLLALSACGDNGGPAKKVDDKPATAVKAAQAGPLDSRWQAHLADMPSGQVSARAPLVVRFNHPVVDDKQLNRPVDGLIRLQPAVSATAVFTATDRLEVRHDPFKAGAQGVLTLYADKLDGIDNSLPPASLPFTIMQQQLTLSVQSLLPAEQEGDQLVLKGRLETRDLAANDKVEAVVSARQQGNNLPVTWQHDSAGLSHRFTVSGIQRGDAAGQFTLDWQGKPLGVEQHGERHFEVPALAAFTVTNVRAASYPQAHLAVNFSAPLQGNQNLRGLVTLNGREPKLQVDGSTLNVFPAKDDNEKVALVIHAGLRAASGARLADRLEKTLTLISSKPGVRFVGKGTILPDGKVLSVPFEARAVHAVKVQAFQVFADNVGRYLQNNGLDSASMDARSGRYLWQKTLSLPPGGQGWQRYQLDLTELMARHPQGLIHLTLKIDGSTIDYQCPAGALKRQAKLPKNYEGPGQQRPGDEQLQDYYRDAGYLSWYQQDNPCSDSYYKYNDLASSTRAFLASNLGLIAKQGQNDQLYVMASSLDANQPLQNVDLNVYNYQLQPIGQGHTDQAGMATLTLDGTPYYLKAQQGKQVGYLKLARNRALPTNQFNTGGEQVRDGLKGFFYGERDVWRPGDDIHLTFILQDKQHRIPDDHPLTLDWFDPRGNKVNSYTLDKPVGNFYAFTLHTDEQAPTGNWRAVARLGQRYFDTPVRVEAIKPNHLKIELGLPERLYANQSAPVTLFSQWLNGATAAGLKADVKVRVSDRTTRFDGYQAYHFDDPTRALKSEPFTAFEGQLDSRGHGSFPLQVPVAQAPGMVQAVLTTRVFENSGDYSTQVRSVPVYPYHHWVGMKVPKGSGWGDSLSRDKQHGIDLMTLDSDGKPDPNRALDITVYRIDWRWWWDRSDDKLTNFISDPNTREVTHATVTTGQDGHGVWQLNGADYKWGRHLIRVCEKGGHHCSAQTVYLGWSWDQAAGSQDAATRLSLSADKPHYRVGDTAHIELPAVASGRLLVSLETGSQVLDHYWLAATGQPQTLDIPITAAMAPNVYVNVALLQPHQRNNDRPIRLYGVVPLLVEDPATRLTPQIQAPDKVKPGQRFRVDVSEKHGRAMTYTLAVVDEGLLGLTNYRTPDPHDAFYQREALGVQTWDLYDLVVGAYGAELDQLLALGGSDALASGHEKQRRRFPPVVKFLGPFTLAANQTAHHDISLPTYMGQVRVMVVAGNDKAYGRAQKDVTVTQPLTVLSTLPRVLGPGEDVSLPVTVFVTDDKIKTVNLSVQADDDLFTVEQGQAALTFDGSGDQIALLRLHANQRVGKGQVTVTARAGDQQTSETVTLPVRAANPPTTRDQRQVLAAGQSWAGQFTPHGMPGTNAGTLTVSALPAMGLERRLQYLLNYPHGCIEQTTSAVLPQLYLPQLVSLDDSQQQTLQNNVQGGIERLRHFQLADGAFSYWPGQANASDWGTSYAGHFLLEARRLGYAVPAQMLDNWQRYQIHRTQSLGQRPWQWSAQAYRLYTLALAGKPQVGAMNRLRERLNLAGNDYGRWASYHNGRWLLAAAYQQMGLGDVAAELIAGAQPLLPYQHAGYTYGSSLRDQAIRLTVKDAAGDDRGAWQLADDIAASLASDHWYSTQSTAWALMAMARYAGSDDDEAGFSFAWRDGSQSWQRLQAGSPVFQQALAGDASRGVAVRNDSQRKLFVTLSNTGTPAPGEEQPFSDGLRLAVQFMDAAGQPLNPASLAQGTDFHVRVLVTNTSNRNLEHLALTQILPSGWQLTSSRLDGSAAQHDTNKGNKGDRKTATAVTYQDWRDDRVLSYFDLPAHKDISLAVDLNASFAGHYYLPAWTVEAMYDGSKQARSRGQWVTVKP
ncbi:MAG: MG2 domain-containing protein [Alcanivorax sp.]|nr:MG2 domain-containing protein [Alcanivorax sp.]